MKKFLLQKTINIFGLMSGILFIICTLSSYAQTSNEWQLLSRQAGLEIYMQKTVITPDASAIPIEYAVFQYRNNTASSVRLSFKIDVWYGESCRSCSLNSPNEYEQSITLKPGEKITGKAGSDNKAMSVISRILTPASHQQGITKVEFNRLIIETL